LRLPAAFRRDKNAGYAFVEFETHDEAVACSIKWEGLSFPDTHSEKVIQVIPAARQPSSPPAAKSAMLRRYSEPDGDAAPCQSLELTGQGTESSQALASASGNSGGASPGPAAPVETPFKMPRSRGGRRGNKSRRFAVQFLSDRPSEQNPSPSADTSSAPLSAAAVHALEPTHREFKHSGTSSSELRIVERRHKMGHFQATRSTAATTNLTQEAFDTESIASLEVVEEVMSPVSNSSRRREEQFTASNSDVFTEADEDECIPEVPEEPDQHAGDHLPPVEAVLPQGAGDTCLKGEQEVPLPLEKEERAGADSGPVRRRMCRRGSSARQQLRRLLRRERRSRRRRARHARSMADRLRACPADSKYDHAKVFQNTMFDFQSQQALPFHDVRGFSPAWFSGVPVVPTPSYYHPMGLVGPVSADGRHFCQADEVTLFLHQMQALSIGRSLSRQESLLPATGIQCESPSVVCSDKPPLQHATGPVTRKAPGLAEWCPVGCRRILLRNIPMKLTKADLRKALDTGPLVGVAFSLRLPRGAKPKTNRGYAFLQFASTTDATATFDLLHGLSVGIRSEKLTRASPAKKQP